MLASTLLATLSLFLLPSATAFKDTAPLLIWSSVPNPALEDASSEIDSGIILAHEVYGTISTLGCDWTTMVVVHVDGLHESHLAKLSVPPKPSLHIPYLLRPRRFALDGAIDSWAQLCGAEVVDSLDVDSEYRKVVKVDAKRTDLSTLSSEADIIILTGTPSLLKRQDEETPFPEDPDPSPSSTLGATATSTSTATSGPNNHTLPDPSAPLLQRVQLLTTPIITSLLITFFVFVPIIAMGISALAGIQVPPRMLEISKSNVGKEKKDQ
ncbi:hypothetical protein P7C73_g4196, partial [Tremellales sp. Uapishka_1]